MGVAAQVAEDVLGAAEGRLGIDNPGLVGCEADHQAVEGRIAELREGPLSTEPPQGVQHLPPQKLAHHFHGKQEVFADVDEPLPIEREPARGDEHMDVRVEVQFPCPGVEHHRQAQRGIEARSPQFLEQFTDGMEQRGVDLYRVPPRQGAQFRRRRRHHMEVPHGQDPLGPCVDPLLLSQGLALGTVAVPAGVVDRVFPPAAGADLQVAAEGGGPAAANGREDALLGPGQTLLRLQARSVLPHDVRNVVDRAREAHCITWTSPPGGFSRRRSGSGKPGCRSSWTGCCRGPEPPGSFAGPCRGRAGSWRSYAEACGA